MEERYRGRECGWRQVVARSASWAAQMSSATRATPGRPMSCGGSALAAGHMVAGHTKVAAKVPSGLGQAGPDFEHAAQHPLPANTRTGLRRAAGGQALTVLTTVRLAQRELQTRPSSSTA